MSCRHDLALGTCKRCYPKSGTIDPGPEEDYGPNLDGPGAVTASGALNETFPGTPKEKEEVFFVNGNGDETTILDAKQETAEGEPMFRIDVSGLLTPIEICALALKLSLRFGNGLSAQDVSEFLSDMEHKAL